MEVQSQSSGPSQDLDVPVGHAFSHDLEFSNAACTITKGKGDMSTTPRPLSPGRLQGNIAERSGKIIALVIQFSLE